MLFLFLSELLEHGAPAGILRDARGAGIELEPAALGGDGDAERVARENHLGRAALGTPGRPVWHSSHVP